MEVSFAHHQPAYHTSRQGRKGKEQGPGSAEEPPEEGSLHEGLYHDAEEAELGFEKGCQGSFGERSRSNRLYPRDRSQPPGAPSGACPRRQGEGPSRCEVPHHPWYS